MRNALLALVLVLSLPSLASAQTAAPGPGGERKGRIGASAVVGLPIGDWGNAVNFSLGVLGDLDYTLTPVLTLTGRAGFIYHLADGDGLTFYTIPIWVGGKYYLAPVESSARFFAAGELGLNFTHIEVEVGGFKGSDTETDLGLNLGGGVDLGAISVRAWFAFLDLGHAGDSMEIMASASYFFAAF